CRPSKPNERAIITNPFNVDLDSLSKAYNKAIPSMSPDEQLISAHIYRLFAEGKPVSHKQVADSTNLPFEKIEDIINNWIGVYHNDNNEIIGYWGIALRDMPHKFEVDGRTLYTWCAWDSLFIPELMQKTAHVESPDPITKEIIKFTVSPDGIIDLFPSESVMSYVKPEYTVWDENVINSFCHFVLFFASQKSGEEWTSTRENTALMSMDDAFELAKRKNRHQFSSVLAPEESKQF
ncbi:hypothetical protein IID62_11335, partial [candidate division KSB1 bacterium]|nr:hypothetical protein [candidate division KSB1 bacterium]